MERVFVLSPASCRGRRAALLLAEESASPLRRTLQTSEATLGEVFSFISSLYFRGKLTYARAFASPADIWIITPDEGLRPAEDAMTVERLRRFATRDIHQDDAVYAAPLAAGARRLAASRERPVVLLGSVATEKYVSVLGRELGDRLLFPSDFVGRGDMSRGGLLLRAASEGRELAYEGVLASARHGKRPPRLPKLEPRPEPI